MSFLFDSSAIFKAIKENTVETLLGNNTLELTRYEQGKHSMEGIYTTQEAHQ